MYNDIMIQCYVKSIYCTNVVGSGLHEAGGSSASVSLLPGDAVEVVEGELKGLEGKVVSVGDDTITIMPRHEDLKVIAWILILTISNSCVLSLSLSLSLSLLHTPS